MSLRRRDVLIGLAGLSASTAISLEALAPSSGIGISRPDTDPDWTAPQPPFRIAGNIYYVGSRDLASYLIPTPQGHILINGNLESSPPQIRASVEKLGFKFSDVRILLISHAHFDHCGGSAEILMRTQAKYMVMDADVADVESGGRTNFQFANDRSMFYPPAKVSRILHDGDQVKLGGTTLTAIKTPGHTKGCTTWTMQLNESSKPLNVVIVGSPNVLASYDLLHSTHYPTMASDFAKTFQILESVPCDVFLGAHASSYNMLDKFMKLKSGNQNAFTDPAGYTSYVAQAKSSFEKDLTRQRAVKAHRQS